METASLHETISEHVRTTIRPTWLQYALAAAIGFIAIAGPFALHLLVSQALVKKLSQTIETYTSGEVTIGAAWPVGLKRPGIIARRINIRLHGNSPHRITEKPAKAPKGTRRSLSNTTIEIPSIRGYLGPGSLKSITIILENPRIRAFGNIEELSEMMNRFRGRTTQKRPASGRTATIQVLNLHAEIEIYNSPIVGIITSGSNIVLKKCRNRNRTCHTAKVGSLEVTLHNKTIVSGKDLAWRSFSSPQAEIRRVAHSKTATMTGFRGFQIDRLNARLLNVRLPGNLGRFSFGPALSENNLVAAFTLEETGEDLLDMNMTAYIADGKGGRVRINGITDLQTGQTNLQADFTNMTARILALEREILSNDKTRVNGKMKAFLGPGNKGSAEFDLNVDADTEVVQHRIARTPVRIKDFHVSLRGSARWDDSVRILDLTEMRLKKNDVTATIRGRIRQDDKGAGCILEAALPSTPCQSLLDAIPAEMIPALEGMILSGNLAAKVSIGAHSQNIDDLFLAISSEGGCSVEKDPPGADVNHLLLPYTMQVKTAEGNTENWILGEENLHFRSLERLPDHLIRAFLTTEDREFFTHKGFDHEQIRRALAYNAEHRGFYKGASTISQQLVKNVFLNHNRTVSRKFQEAVLTWRLEQVVPKNRILELYLNLIEMGPGIYGVSHASRVYFSRPISRLAPLQSLHLAAITPSPVRYYETFKGGRISMDWLLHLRNLLGQMRRQGHLSNYVYRTSMNSELIIAAY